MIKFFIILIIALILLILMRVITDKYRKKDSNTSSENYEVDNLDNKYYEDSLYSNSYKPKKEPKPFFERPNECMSMEEIAAEVRAHDTSYRLKSNYYNKYGDYEFSESSSSSDEIEICPICGSTDYVGDYCDECGWIE